MVAEFTLGLVFLVIGVIMLVIEAASPGFFLAVPATVLIVIGLLGMFLPGFLFSVWSPVLAMLIGIPTTLFTMWFYSRFSPPSPPTTTVGESLISRQGMVTALVRPHSLRGKVRIGNESWSATSDDIIPVGERVLVIGSEGVHVIVRRLTAPGKGKEGGSK